MKTLLVARHAKSSWTDPGLADHERPLNGRGQRSAPLVAQALRHLDLVPDLVLSSTSARTRETWALMSDELGHDIAVDYLSELYLAPPSSMLRVVRSSPDTADTVMILGHNPGMHSLALALTEMGDPHDVNLLNAKFPTGAVAVIEFSGRDWATVGSGGVLSTFIRPRDLE